MVIFYTLFLDEFNSSSCENTQKNSKLGYEKKWATATKMENILVKPHKDKCTYKKFYRNITEYAKYLKPLG